MSSQSLADVPPSTPGRVRDVDALRGFALLGIFVVNITFMASAYPGNLVADPAFSSWIDDAARFVVSALFSMKFYLLFSFLFGYSFVLQMEAAQRAAARFTPRMVRRIVGLFALGVVHIVVLYSGDVLTTYAVAALILLAMRGVRNVVALRVAAAIYTVVLASLVVSAAFIDRADLFPSRGEALSTAAEQTGAMRGGFGDIVEHHLSGIDLLVVQAVSLQGPTALAMFLLGLVAARKQLFAGAPVKTGLLRRVQLVGYPLGLVGGVIYAAWGAETSTAATAVSVATAPFLTAAYVATLLRLMHGRRTSWLRDALAPAGRLALTNYLGQSLVGLIVFTGIGAGLAGRVSPALLIVLAFVVFAGQVIISAWWLVRHRYGPAEYVLRWITNWQKPTRQSRHRPARRSREESAP